MSQHTIDRIANVITAQFKPHIDMSDWIGRPEDQQRQAFLSRALAALCIKGLTGASPQAACGSLTDGFHDNGLDAIYFDTASDTLVLVQTKWSANGTKSLDADHSGAFVSGARDLLDLKFERFNERIRAKEAEVRAALYSDRDIRIRLVVAHTGTQPPAPFVTRKVDDFVQELNDPVPSARADYFDQAGVYDLVTAESREKKLKLQIGLNDWGMIETPFLAYYGRVHVSEVAQWWRQHRNSLFTQNLRLFYLNSDVNDALRRTLTEDPDSFWYLNNGVTLICDSISKGLAGAPGHKVGIFTCEGASVVNGAQTVGTIGSASEAMSDVETNNQDPQSWVQARLISLERCPPNFGRRITRAANLQNAVGNREFAAMDPLQYRIATDFALDRRKYVYKSGEADPRGAEGCSIVEATQALGCAKSVQLAVQVKREIGGVWADTAAAPYTDIFNDSLSTTRLWRAVIVMRAVDEELQKLRSSELPRADMTGIHMNRVILHLVFRDPRVVGLFDKDTSSEEALLRAAADSAQPAFEKVVEYLENHHPSEYLASLCKNVGKCEALVESVLTPKSQRLIQSTIFDILASPGSHDGQANA